MFLMINNKMTTTSFPQCSLKINHAFPPPINHRQFPLIHCFSTSNYFATVKVQTGSREFIIFWHTEEIKWCNSWSVQEICIVSRSILASFPSTSNSIVLAVFRTTAWSPHSSDNVFIKHSISSGFVSHFARSEIW